MQLAGRCIRARVRLQRTWPRGVTLPLPGVTFACPFALAGGLTGGVLTSLLSCEAVRAAPAAGAGWAGAEVFRPRAALRYEGAALAAYDAGAAAGLWSPFAWLAEVSCKVARSHERYDANFLQVSLKAAAAARCKHSCHAVVST